MNLPKRLCRITCGGKCTKLLKQTKNYGRKKRGGKTMTPEEFQQRLAKMQIDIKDAVNSDLPKIVGNEAARLFRKNFQDEGFFGDKWKPAKRIGTAKGAADSRKTLTDTGDLGRSIQVKTEPGRATVYSDLPYSAVHNEGLKAGRGKGFTMPKRQFMGESDKVTQSMKNKILNYLNEKIK